MNKQSRSEPGIVGYVLILAIFVAVAVPAVWPAT